MWSQAAQHPDSSVEVGWGSQMWEHIHLILSLAHLKHAVTHSPADACRGQGFPHVQQALRASEQHQSQAEQQQAAAKPAVAAGSPRNSKVLRSACGPLLM